MNANAKQKKLTIAELEAILNRDDTIPFKILPNGEIREADSKEIAELGAKQSPRSSTLIR